jgi:cytoplasmic FMR1 interacting protein
LSLWGSFENLQVHAQNPVEGNSFLDRYGDAVAWGGCTILYLLGQQLRFELLDFTYHVLSVAEAEALPSAQLSLAEKSKSSYPSLVKKNSTNYYYASPFNTSMPKCVCAHAYSFENLF